MRKCHFRTKGNVKQPQKEVLIPAGLTAALSTAHPRLPFQEGAARPPCCKAQGLTFLHKLVDNLPTEGRGTKSLPCPELCLLHHLLAIFAL